MSQKQEKDLWQEDHTINISGKNDEISCCDQEKPVMIIIIEGSLEVKLPTIWTDEKQRWEESERREE